MSGVIVLVLFFGMLVTGLLYLGIKAETQGPTITDRQAAEQMVQEQSGVDTELRAEMDQRPSETDDSWGQSRS